MQYKGLMGLIYNISNWIMRLAYINFLWIVFSIAGLVVFGFFPATAAMFAVIRNLIIHNDDRSIFKTFWKSYKSEFMQANIIGYFMFIVTYLLYINFMFIQAMDSGFMTTIILVIFFTFGIIFAVVFLYVFPVLVHYKLKTVETIKSAFLIGVLSPFYTLLMVSTIGAIIFGFFLVPNFSPFFFGSVLTLFIMANAYRAIIKVDHHTVRD